MNVKFKIDLFGKNIPIQMDVPDDCIEQYCEMKKVCPVLFFITDFNNQLTMMVAEALHDSDVQGRVIPVDEKGESLINLKR